MNLASLVFLSPWVLLALASLPVLWWLLRVIPPAPRHQPFPAIRLLFGLKSDEQTSSKTPWWLLLLRLLAAALLILAISHPILSATAGGGERGPLLVVVDNGWASARDWRRRLEAAEAAIDRAGRDNREVRLLPTAATADGSDPVVSPPLTAEAAKASLSAMNPLPWPTDHEKALAAFRKSGMTSPAQALWVADGIGGESSGALATQLQRLGRLDVVLSETGAHLVGVVERDGDALLVPVKRIAEGQVSGAQQPAVAVRVRASDASGRAVAVGEAVFAEGAAEAKARLELPPELANEVVRLDLDAINGAGSVALLDERWRRRPVGLVSGNPRRADLPLLGDLYYLEKALAPYAELRKGEVAQLIERELSILVLSDYGRIPDEDQERLETWVRNGGVLVRFAGPNMANGGGEDRLLPVRLRFGGRTMGGALSWSHPVPLAPFAASSPFAGLPVPQDVTVRTQVLADPSPDLVDKTWAQLSDGTPLVTAERRGEGQIVLFHTSANPDWSDLSISGLYVQMLRRLMALGRGVGEGGTGAGLLRPVEVLDGYGRVVQPGVGVQPIAATAFPTVAIGPAHPPGWYGLTDSRRSISLGERIEKPEPLPTLPAGVKRVSLEEAAADIDFKPYLLAACLVLLLIDGIVSLGLRGLLIPSRNATAALLALALAGGVVMPEARAQSSSGQGNASLDAAALASALETRLAHVVTKDAEVDRSANLGLKSLTRVLADRTAAVLGEPVAVDLERDPILFYPLLYWPITDKQLHLSGLARDKVNDYLRRGGMILFDTRDEGIGRGSNDASLRRLTFGLDIPPLTVADTEHVLARTFYLLREFPGLYTGGPVYVQQGTRGLDGVSPVILGGNDWAGAWARDRGRSLSAMPTGDERQRELAFRFGVNVVMYALTGNYKADQVHLPAIMERLTQ